MKVYKSPSKADDLQYLADRGDRLAKVRESTGLNGEEFAGAIVAAARGVGISVSYDKAKVSRLEAGKATVLLAEEAAIISGLDPESRGVEWLVLGAGAKVKRLPRGPLPEEPLTRVERSGRPSR